MNPKDTQYEPYNDLRLYPGAQLSDQRREQLDGDGVEPDELSVDDIVYKLSRMTTGTLYSLIALMEEPLGKEATRKLIFEWGRQRARKNLERWMRARGVKQLTPELWARFQDYRHLISGTIHSPSFIRYEGDSRLVLERRSCLFHSGRPAGMDSYCSVAADGMFVGYREVCPELSCEHPICMSRGTSEDHCQVRFTIED